MYKKIIEGDTLTITGLNLYPDSTQVFFNTTGNEAPAIAGSFNSSFSRVSVVVPCCLPRLNKVILYNGINYATGEGQYQFIGKPAFSGITDDSLKWGESALVSGSNLSETTGVFVESVQSEYYVESENSVVFTMPNDIPSGINKDLTVMAKAGSFTTSIEVLEPDIEGVLSEKTSLSGLKFNESGFLNGQGLHRVNRVIVTGLNGEISLTKTNIFNVGSTGLHFVVPEGTLNGYPVKLQNHSGFLSEGGVQSVVYEQAITSNNLKVVSPFITAISTGAGKYQDSITVSGPQIENCKILFSGYDQTNVEATSTATGLNSNTVTVPRGIVRSQLIASGYTGDTDGVRSSNDFFYPIPTITGLSTTNFVHGEQVTIDAINASEARALVGLRGGNLIESTDGTSYSSIKTHFVSAPTSYSSSLARDYGYATLDNSSLALDINTGVTKINATINANFIGEGTPFLVSEYEGGVLNNFAGFAGKIINIPNYNSISVSGKEPSIMGVSKSRVSRSDQVTISGNNFMNAYRLTLASSSESKFINSGLFIDTNQQSTHEFITFANTGNNNPNYQTHSVSVNLSSFNFVGSNGSFSFSQPKP